MQSPPKYHILYPLALLYGLAIGIRNALYNRGVLPTTEHDVPVICVGNIAVGGTGKTPHVDYLVTLLKKHFRVAVLSRGYLRKSKGFRIVTGMDTVALAGDEPLQLAIRHNDITVAVDRDRNHGIREIMNQRPDTEVIIMDDGFQHRTVTPGKSIVLTDWANLYIDDHLMPVGRLREHISNIRRADFVLITKAPPSLSAMDRRIIIKKIGKYPYQNLFFTAFRYGSPVAVFPGSATDIPDEETVKESDILLLTGIANPAPLMEHIKGIAGTVKHKRYPDHHNFSVEEISRLADKNDETLSKPFYIFTTEKDAARLRMLEDLPARLMSVMFYIPVEVEFLNNDADEFNNHIINYVRKNKGNRRIPG